MDWYFQLLIIYMLQSGTLELFKSVAFNQHQNIHNCFVFLFDVNTIVIGIIAMRLMQQIVWMKLKYKILKDKFESFSNNLLQRITEREYQQNLLLVLQLPLVSIPIGHLIFFFFFVLKGAKIYAIILCNRMYRIRQTSFFFGKCFKKNYWIFSKIYFFI